jgi:hypothetical protein
LDGLEYLIQQDAEEIASTKIDELNKERYTGYLRDVETHLEDMKRMNHDISNLPYLKETFNILEPVPKIQKDVAMDFQAKESNLDYIGEYKKANKKLERTRRQRTLTHIHTFIRDDLHDQLEINAKSIIKRETAVIEQDKKKIIPTVASANKKQKGISSVLCLL